MKIKLSLIVVLTALLGLTYTSCKKNNSNPSGPALSAKQVSGQLALNVSQMLTSGFGAYSITGGFNAPATMGMVKTKNGLRLNSDGDLLCGTVADTTLNYSYSDAGNSATVKGELKFTFGCTNGVLSSFTVFDNLTVGETTADISVNYKLAEDLTVAALTLNDDNTNISLNGTLSLGGNYTYKGSTKGSGTSSFAYTFHNIIADAGGDLISGSADFQTSGTGTNGVWNYTGTITFLGNNQAKVVINGANYTVNLLTGAVS